jgi:hypothetical protein
VQDTNQKKIGVSVLTAGEKIDSQEIDMRIWTIHPRYLDSIGLVAAWREGLLAQKVLLGNTKGYKNHPQLLRFRNSSNQTILISNYIYILYLEARNRGYKFDSTKIQNYVEKFNEKIIVTNKQVEYEFTLLKWKLENRNKSQFDNIKDVKYPAINEIFVKVDGEIEKWEKVIVEIRDRCTFTK